LTRRSGTVLLGALRSLPQTLHLALQHLSLALQHRMGFAHSRQIALCSLGAFAFRLERMQGCSQLAGLLST
jgi:hypothetical protein